MCWALALNFPQPYLIISWGLFFWDWFILYLCCSSSHNIQILFTESPSVKEGTGLGNWEKRGPFSLAFPVPSYFKLAAVSLYVSKCSSPGTISWRPRRCHMHFLSLLWLMCQEAGRVIGKGAGLSPGTPRAAVRARLPHKFEQEVRRAIDMSRNIFNKGLWSPPQSSFPLHYNKARSILSLNR